MADDGPERFPNPYLAATTLPPGPRRLEAVRQFLEDEQHTLHTQLQEIENDDGTIPDDATAEWSMTKGKLDQTRLFHGMVVHAMLKESMTE